MFYYQFINSEILLFFSKHPGPGGTKAVLDVKWSTNNSLTEPAKFRYISTFRAKKKRILFVYLIVSSKILKGPPE